LYFFFFFSLIVINMLLFSHLQIFRRADKNGE